MLRSVDLFLVYWGSPLIAHTILSFVFDGDRYLAVSIETRKDGAEAYSAVRTTWRSTASASGPSVDEHRYAIGAVRGDLPLAELRARGHVNDRARAAEQDPDFSGRIREGMPARFSAR